MRGLIRPFIITSSPNKWPFRGRAKPGNYGRLRQATEWKIDEWTENLYTTSQADRYPVAPGAKFTWTRFRAVGARTLLWGRECARFGPLGFKPKSLQEGFGEDWPIIYEEVAPCYDKLETLIRLADGDEEVYNRPVRTHVLPSFRPRCGEWLIKKAQQSYEDHVLSSGRPEQAL